MSNELYQHFPKKYTVTVSGWELFKAKIFGMKWEEVMITAYFYKGKWYITRLGS